MRNVMLVGTHRVPLAHFVGAFVLCPMSYFLSSSLRHVTHSIVFEGGIMYESFADFWGCTCHCSGSVCEVALVYPVFVALRVQQGRLKSQLPNHSFLN
mmetsp:Transcript_19669/g.31884  ORF Transcript_19669/g.31884 Transcript_19669/m.31884 type:complete len:98 (-) Transcript_19669:80-373(-)